MAYLEISGLCKKFGNTEVLKSVNMEVEQGELCTILGQSGSGKSTLLNCIGGLTEAGSGKITVGGEVVSDLRGDALTDYRRRCLGFVFQFYNLVPNLTVLENIELGEYLSDNPLSMDEILTELGISKLRNRFPKELSGGQMQRCSIGRALIKNPKLLLCDEPTGALDYATSKEILSLIRNVNRKFGTTVIIVTHNRAISEMTNRTVVLKDGSAERCEINPVPRSPEEIEW